MTTIHLQPFFFRAKQWACLLLAALTASLLVAQESLPTGFRRPTSFEAKGSWRVKSPTRFLIVRGDFDGDGKADVAELLVRESGRGFALFVRLSSQGDRWQRIHGGDTSLSNFGIRIVWPGKYETFCADDPSVCAPDTAKTIDLRTDAIKFFAWGEADSFFHWDQTAKKCRNAPQSD